VEETALAVPYADVVVVVALGDVVHVWDDDGGVVAVDSMVLWEFPA
jgi:hypothetical protein